MKTIEFDEKILLDCIHCGLCLSSCPSYAVLGTEADSPRGRIFMMRAVTEGRMEINKTVKKHIDLCLACRGCETSCPSGVIYHPLLETVQQQIRNKIKQPLLSRLLKKFILNTIFPYPARLKQVFRLMRLYQVSGLQRIIRSLRLLRIISLKLEKSELFLPAVMPVSVNYNGTVSNKYQDSNRLKAGFLRGCLMDYFFPDTNRATLEVLEKCRCDVVIPEEQFCCGAVHMHSGDIEKAKEFARNTIDVFLSKDVDVIITNAAGCGAMMKEYNVLLSDDPDYADKAELFSTKVKDISEFICGIMDYIKLGPVKKAVVYDDPCHLIHAQKISKQPRDILMSIPGLSLLPLTESEMCCGSAGTFNIVQPELSEEVLRRKMENIRESGAEAVVTANIGCMIQLKRGIKMLKMDLDLYHIIDIVDMSIKNSGKD